MSNPNTVTVSQVSEVTTVEITTAGPQGETGATGATGPQGPAVSDGDKGDITVSNSGGTFTIDDDAVTYAKIQNVSATDRVLGRDSSGAGVIEEITPANLRTMINVEDGATGDQTDAEIKTAYENNSDTNAFTDTEKSKLAAIEASADVTDATNVDAAGAVMNSDSTTAAMSFVVDEDNMSSDSATKVPTQQSVKAYVDSEVAGVVDSAPSALNTLNELAAALGDDANFSTTVTNSIGTKLPLAGGTMTGNIVMSGSETVDGRDVSADGTKLDGIEASADVTDATNVDAAGAVMNSDLDGKGELLVGDGSGDPTALAAGTNGYVLKANSSTATGLEWAAETGGGSGEANQNAFSTVAVSGQSDVAADSATDTLTLAAGSNVTITTNASNDTVTIASTDTNTTYSVGDGGLTQNNFTNTLKTKLDGIEASATADQTGAEIKSAYEGESDTNAFTDAEKTKLSGIEASATADQTAAEIRTLVESASDSNVFTDADHTKLNGIEASATADQTDAEIKTAYENNSDTNAFTDAEKSKLSGIAASANVGLTDVVGDTTPQLGGNLDVQSSEITTSTSNGNIKLNPNGTGVVEVKGDGSSADGTIQLNCSQNSHGIKLKSPPHSAGASYTLTFPDTDGNANQVLKTDGSGGLDWVDQTTDTNTTYSAGSGLSLSGTTFSVDTLNQDTTGSAATLTTPRAINGVNFDGSADITIADSTKIPTAGGTFTGSVTFEDAINETIFAISDASSVALDPDNGMMQTWTLGANRTATDSLTTGQSMILIVTASGSNYTVTWPTMTWVGGSAPTLGGATPTAIELFKVGSTLYGATVGDLG